MHSSINYADDCQSSSGATVGNASTIKRGGGNAALQHAITVGRGGRGRVATGQGKHGVNESKLHDKSQRQKSNETKQQTQAALKRRIFFDDDRVGNNTTLSDTRASIAGLTSPRGGSGTSTESQENSHFSSQHEKLIPLPPSVLQRQSALYRELNIPYVDYITNMYATEEERELLEAADISYSTSQSPRDGRSVGDDVHSPAMQSQQQLVSATVVSIHKRLLLIARAFASAATVAPKTSAQLRNEELLKKMFEDASEALRSELVGILGDKENLNCSLTHSKTANKGTMGSNPLSTSGQQVAKDGMPLVSTKTVVASRIAKRLLSDPIMHSALSKIKKEKSEGSAGHTQNHTATLRLAPIAASPTRALSRSKHGYSVTTPLKAQLEESEYVSTLPPIAASLLHQRKSPLPEDLPNADPGINNNEFRGSAGQSEFETHTKRKDIVKSDQAIEMNCISGQQSSPLMVSSATIDNTAIHRKSAGNTRHPALILFDVQELVEAEQRRILREYKALANNLNGHHASPSSPVKRNKSKSKISEESQDLPSGGELPHLLSDFFHLHLDFTKIKRQSLDGQAAGNAILSTSAVAEGQQEEEPEGSVTISPVELIYIVHYLTTLQNSQGSLNHVKRLVAGLVSSEALSRTSSGGSISDGGSYSYLSSCHDFDDCGGEDIVSVLQSINSIGSINLSNLSVVGKESNVTRTANYQSVREELASMTPNLLSSLQSQTPSLSQPTSLSVQELQDRKHLAASYKRVAETVATTLILDNLIKKCPTIVDIQLPQPKETPLQYVSQSPVSLVTNPNRSPTKASLTKSETFPISRRKGNVQRVASRAGDSKSNLRTTSNAFSVSGITQSTELCSSSFPISEAVQQLITTALNKNAKRQRRIERQRGGSMHKSKSIASRPSQLKSISVHRDLNTKTAESISSRQPSISSSASLGISGYDNNGNNNNSIAEKSSMQRRTESTTGAPILTSLVSHPQPHPLAIGGSIQRTLHGARRPKLFATGKQLSGGDSRPQTAEDFSSLATGGIPSPTSVTTLPPWSQKNSNQAPTDVDFFIWENSNRLAVTELETQSMLQLLRTEHNERLVTARGVQFAFTAKRNIKERKEFERIALQEMLTPHVFVKEARQYKKLLMQMVQEEETIGRAGIHRSLRRMEEQLRRENREALVAIKRKQRAKDEAARAEQELLLSQAAVRQQSQAAYKNE